MSILKETAVARRSGAEAGQILGFYIDTNPLMNQAHTNESTAKPAAPGNSPMEPQK